ncbi:MAG: hypothetical protein Q4P25_04105 [Tissierellia bacterium]|nr:hypothetical protein [Tissierellia bacterium]
MTLDQIINQLEDLKEHCEELVMYEGDIWTKDVCALDKAVEVLKLNKSLTDKVVPHGYYLVNGQGN